jgi:hypothetical protein
VQAREGVQSANHERCRNSSDTRRVLLSRRGTACGTRNQSADRAEDLARASALSLTHPSALSLTGAIDGGAGHAEQVGELSGGVLAALEQGHQVRFLPRIELGLLTA